MKHFHYMSDILSNEESKKTLKELVNPRIFFLLTQDNTYPIIEHDEKHDLFVLLIPIYESNRQLIRLVECNILIGDRDLYILTNSPEEIFDTIIDQIKDQRKEHDSTIYSIILELSNHILDTIDQIERRIERLQHLTIDSQWYTEDIIQDVMRSKLMIGMFKSTITPLSEIVIQLFEKVNHPDTNTETTRNNHIAYMIKQIAAQSTFLYENISILADTSNAIQNIRANNIMKTLTMISSIFIPLSFITGIFGMNFTDLPINNTEIYYAIIFFMLFIWLIQFYVFKRKKWF